MTEPRILIACVGNILRGDDGFGVEVARQLLNRNLPPHVNVVEFGIRGFDLGFALLDDYQAVILIDASQRGGEPGTLYVIEPELDQLSPEETQTVSGTTHGMIPEQVLLWAKAVRGSIPPVHLLACEPATLGTDEDMMIGLSKPVENAVTKAVILAENLILEISRPQMHSAASGCNQKGG